MTLSNRAAITGLYANLFSVTRTLQKYFQLTPEGKTPNIKKNPTEIRFDKKMVNKSGEVFLLTTKFYESTNNAAILVPKKWKPEGKSAAQLEDMSVKKE